MYGRCACYFTDNFHVPGLGHVHFDGSVATFLRRYSSAIVQAGLSVEEVVAIVERELDRRNADADKRTDENRKAILARYEHLHPDLLQLRTEHLAPEFLAMENNQSMIESFRIRDRDFELFHFPLLSRDFCDRLSIEIDSFCSSGCSHRQPNTMNKSGVVLDELGLDCTLAELRRRLQPLASRVYPDWVADGLDSHRAFTVDYSASPDCQSSLDLHFDNAEVTANVALSSDGAFTGGELFFCKLMGNFTDQDQTACYPPIGHRQGWAVLHCGRQLHATLPVSSGRRRNMIVWMRSSTVRNRLCPMCGSEPRIIPVGTGYGDGFTISDSLVPQDRDRDDVVDVCNML